MEMIHNNGILNVILFDRFRTHCRDCGIKIKHNDIVYEYVGEFYKGPHYHYMCLKCGDKLLDSIHLHRNEIINKKQEEETILEEN